MLKFMLSQAFVSNEGGRHSRRKTRCLHCDRDRDAGFTLVELLVVLAILALLAGFAGPQVLRYLGAAKQDTARTQIAAIANALELYFIDVGAYPTSEQGLKALMEAPSGSNRWRGPYMRKEGGLIDPWGRPYSYKSPADKRPFLLSTHGRDGLPGGTGEDADLTH